MRIELKILRGIVLNLVLSEEETPTSLITRLVNEIKLPDRHYVFIYKANVIESFDDLPDGAYIVAVPKLPPCPSSEQRIQEVNTSQRESIEPKSEQMVYSQEAQQVAPDQGPNSVNAANPELEQQISAPSDEYSEEIPENPDEFRFEGEGDPGFEDDFKEMLEVLQVDELYDESNDFWEHPEEILEFNNLLSQSPNSTVQIVVDTLTSRYGATLAANGLQPETPLFLMGIEQTPGIVVIPDYQADIQILSHEQRVQFNYLQALGFGKKEVIEALKKTDFDLEAAERTLRQNSKK